MEAEQGCTGRAFSSTCTELHHYLRGRVVMFEKEAEKWTIDYVCKDCSRYKECKSKEHCTCKNCSKEKWQNGAEFGYNKANEWHFVKDGDYPKKKGIYLVAWERTHHVEEYGEWGFDVDVFNADDGYFEGCGDFVIAWKGIVLPKEN